MPPTSSKHFKTACFMLAGVTHRLPEELSMLLSSKIVGNISGMLPIGATIRSGELKLNGILPKLMGRLPTTQRDR